MSLLAANDGQAWTTVAPDLPDGDSTGPLDGGLEPQVPTAPRAGQMLGTGDPTRALDPLAQALQLLGIELGGLVQTSVRGSPLARPTSLLSAPRLGAKSSICEFSSLATTLPVGFSSRGVCMTRTSHCFHSTLKTTLAFKAKVSADRSE